MPDKPNADLNQIAAPSPEQVSKVPDKPTELEAALAQKARLQIENDGLRQNITERKKYAHRIFVMICIWLASVFLILVLEGFGSAGTTLSIERTTIRFNLPSSVILAVVGSTTINVLGIFYIVTNYLFPKT